MDDVFGILNSSCLQSQGILIGILKVKVLLRACLSDGKKD